MTLARTVLSVSCAIGRSHLRSLLVSRSIQFQSRTRVLSTTLTPFYNTRRCYSTDRQQEFVEKQIENAQLMLKIEKFEKAKQLYDEIIEQNPDDVRGYGGRADALFFLKQYEESIADYKQVIRFAPKCIPALQNIALCHAKLRKFDEAIKDLNYLLAMDSKYMPAYGTRADIFEELGDVDKAADDYMKLLEFDPSNVDALVGLGKLAMKKKAFDDAKEIYTRVVRLDHSTPSVASRLGSLEYSSNVRDGKPFHESHPHIEAYRSLAVIAYDTGDWKNVIPMLDHAKDLELENETYKEEATSLVMRGATYFNTGDLIKAFGFVDKAAKLDNNNAMAHFFRAGIHFSHQNYEKAIGDYKTYLNILNRVSDAADELSVEQILLVLERIVRTGRLQFQKSNGLLTRVRAQPKFFAKSKIPLQGEEENSLPHDPIQDMFGGGSAKDENKDRLVSTKGLGRFDEGPELQFDEKLEHVGVIEAGEREAMKARQLKEVEDLRKYVESGKGTNKLKGLAFISDAINAAQQLQQSGIEKLAPLLQDSILKNIDQLLDVGKEYIHDVHVKLADV